MLEKQANTVFLGIGSNLGNKKNKINKAKLLPQERNNLMIEKSSNFYKWFVTYFLKNGL